MGGKNVQCDVTNYYLNSTGEKYRDITVAVMDTGINLSMKRLPAE